MTLILSPGIDAALHFIGPNGMLTWGEGEELSSAFI